MDNKSELTNNENIAEKLLPTGEKLTKRQKEVLNYLQEGLSNKQIAGKMNISEPTVKLHIHGLFHKLHAINRTQIVLKAAELGLNWNNIKRKEKKNVKNSLFMAYNYRWFKLGISRVVQFQSG